MSLRIQCFTIDTHDPKRIAQWWRDALTGWQITCDTDEEAALEPPPDMALGGLAPDVLFIKVPEDKVLKNRIHMDLRPDDQAAEVARLEAMGARRIDIGQGEQTWVVMADPDGNEFCVLRALTPEELAKLGR